MLSRKNVTQERILRVLYNLSSQVQTTHTLRGTIFSLRFNIYLEKENMDTFSQETATVTRYGLNRHSTTAKMPRWQVLVLAAWSWQVECKVTGEFSSSQNGLIKVRLHEYANLHMTTKSQHRDHMLCSSYSSGSQEVHNDDHANVDGVSDPSTANQELTLLH